MLVCLPGMPRPTHIRLLWLPMRSFFALKPDVRTCLTVDSWRVQSWPLLQQPIPIANFHLTLARRVLEPPPAALIPPRLPCRFETFALYESQPTRSGRAYRTVASWPLAEFKPACLSGSTIPAFAANLPGLALISQLECQVQALSTTSEAHGLPD
jgi:hypothetical protein